MGSSASKTTPETKLIPKCPTNCATVTGPISAKPSAIIKTTITPSAIQGAQPTIVVSNSTCPTGCTPIEGFSAIYKQNFNELFLYILIIIIIVIAYQYFKKMNN